MTPPERGGASSAGRASSTGAASSADAAGVELPPEVVVDELGVHVSVAGGVSRAPERAHDVHSVNLQLFTKQPSRWAEPTLGEREVATFREECRVRGIRVAVSHDSYLINLASPDPELHEHSAECFRGELERSSRLGLDYVVTHPGNATDGDREAGIRRNAEAVGAALAHVEDGPMVLLELTAGGGSTVGGSFEALAEIRSRVPEPERRRVGICLDTCHAYSAGYDLVADYDGVWERFDRTLGLEHLRLLHLNDSQNPLGSRKDRHAHIGQGTLGEGPFRAIMTDARLAGVAKLLETPKKLETWQGEEPERGGGPGSRDGGDGDGGARPGPGKKDAAKDTVTNDRRNLALLRSFRASAV